MKLKEFFKNEKESSLSIEEKINIYFNFLRKKNKSNIFQFIKKVLVYTLLFSVLIISFTNYNYNTYAEYLWKIISVTWDFFILRDWKKEKTYNIYEGDKIYVSSWTSLVFLISSWTYWKIEWEALFEVNKNNWRYYLKILKWDFFEIKWQDIIIETPKYEIENNKIDISVKKLNWKILIKDNTNVKISKKISKRSNEKEENLSGNSILNTEEKLLDEEKLEDKEEIILLDKKVILSEEQKKQLDYLLYNSFIKRDIFNIFISKINNYWIDSYMYLNARIEKIFNIINEKPLDNIMLNIEFLIDYFEDYKYKEILYKIKKWLLYIENIEIKEKIEFKKIDDIIEYFKLDDSYKF